MGSCGWSIDARICSSRDWEALIGLQIIIENLPFDIENEVRYTQSLLLSTLLNL